MVAEQKSSSCEVLKGWSWLPFHPCTHLCLEKWFRLTDLADGSPPRTLSVVGDDNLRGRVCELWEWYCKTVTGPQLYLTAWPSGLYINTLSRVGYPVADYLGLCDADV